MSNNSFAQFVQQINTMNKEQTENQVKINPKENAKWWYKLSLEEKYEIALSVGEECTEPHELKSLLMKKKHPVCYDGFEPSGRMHIA